MEQDRLEVAPELDVEWDKEEARGAGAWADLALVPAAHASAPSAASSWHTSEVSRATKSNVPNAVRR